MSYSFLSQKKIKLVRHDFFFHCATVAVTQHSVSFLIKLETWCTNSYTGRVRLAKGKGHGKLAGQPSSQSELETDWGWDQLGGGATDWPAGRAPNRASWPATVQVIVTSHTSCSSHFSCSGHLAFMYIDTENDLF